MVRWWRIRLGIAPVFGPGSRGRAVVVIVVASPVPVEWGVSGTEGCRVVPRGLEMLSEGAPEGSEGSGGVDSTGSVGLSGLFGVGGPGEFVRSLSEAARELWGLDLCSGSARLAADEERDRRARIAGWCRLRRGECLLRLGPGLYWDLLSMIRYCRCRMKPWGWWRVRQRDGVRDGLLVCRLLGGVRTGRPMRMSRSSRSAMRWFRAKIALAGGSL